MRYFLRFGYKGTHYHGWQLQHNANTVQAEINLALKIILRKEIETVGSGRTDTGVHASMQFLHFDFDKEIAESDELIYKLNALLPDDIAVYQIFKVNDNHHARFDAIERSYQYFIHQLKNPFAQEISYFFPHPLNINQMNNACKKLIGLHDFTSFSKTHTDVFTYNCEVSNANWEWKNEKLIFNISANRFLRGMVRAIVGTMIDVGLGKITSQGFEEIILLKDRKKAGRNVPPEGLFLTAIKYTEELEKFICP